MLFTVRKLLIGTLIVLFSHVLAGVSYADDANVLPKGVFDFGIESRFWFPHDRRFNPDGKVEDIAADFNATLNSNVLPNLALVEAGFGLPAGSANIGDSVVSFERQFAELRFNFLYGLLDRVTVGLMLPYFWQRNKVKAELDTTNATVGKNAALNTIAPLAFPGTVPLTIEDAQNLLGPGLDINGDGTVDVAGFGFDPLETISENGIGDLEVGFRYQYARNKDWRLAFTGGVRFPTGKLDDPENLVDFGQGSGTYALLFHFNHDYMLSNLWNRQRESKVERGEGTRFTPEQLKAAEEQQFEAFRYWGDLVLNFTFRYELIFPSRETLRIPPNVNNPLTANEENIERDFGDIFTFEWSSTYTTLLKGLSFSGVWQYKFKLEDTIDGNQGFAYESLEEESASTSYIFKLGMTYTTLPLVLEKKFPIPLRGSLGYRHRYAGSNNAGKSQYISFRLETFF